MVVVFRWNLMKMYIICKGINVFKRINMVYYNVIVINKYLFLFLILNIFNIFILII